MIDPDEKFREATRLLQEGAFADAADRFDEGVAELLRTLQIDEAVKAACASARARMLAGQDARAEVALEAIGALAQASFEANGWRRARAEVGDRLGDVGLAIERWSALRDATAASDRLLAARRLTALYRQAGDVARAAALANSAIQEAEAAGDAATEVAARLELAAIRLEAGELDACADELDGLDPFAGDPAVDAPVARLDAALAMARGEVEAAEQAAADAREAAVELSDPVQYLQAVQLLVGARIALGDEVTAWDAIVRARVSLRDLLGPPGADLIAPAERAFRDRLGAAMPGVEAEWAAWSRAT